MLDAHLVVQRAGFRLDVELAVPAGAVVALLGPNGAGKTTALRALAGLLPLTAGRITLDGRVVEDPAARLRIAPERRDTGVVFQEYLLFPHLNALDNVAFGPRCRGLGRRAARQVAAGWLQRVGLAGYARTRPRALSGGQAQRVALARALAVSPSLLLLDEPLAALDAKTRLETRAHLRRHLTERSGATVGATVIVTHDPLDAMVLADTIVIIEAGRVVQRGDPAAITREPRSDYVARLVGLNLYRGVAAGAAVTVAGGFALATAEAATGEVFVAFAPAAVALHRTRPDGSPRNVWPATVDGLERHGDRIRVHLAGPIAVAADVTAAAVAELDLEPGREVWAAVKATETRAYPAVAP